MQEWMLDFTSVIENSKRSANDWNQNRKFVTNSPHVGMELKLRAKRTFAIIQTCWYCQSAVPQLKGWNPCQEGRIFVFSHPRTILNWFLLVLNMPLNSLTLKKSKNHAWNSPCTSLVNRVSSKCSADIITSRFARFTSLHTAQKSHSRHRTFAHFLIGTGIGNQLQISRNWRI